MRTLFILMLLAGLAACSSQSGTRTATNSDTPLPPPIQCVPFVRELSGVNLHGDAYTWWDSAEAAGYGRGSVPQVNAVLVLAKTDRLRNGHVAAVRRIVDARHIEVTHANWGSDDATRRLVHDSMPVTDISPVNDWSLVEFFNEQAGVFGRPYPAMGFIYSKAGPPG